VIAGVIDRHHRRARFIVNSFTSIDCVSDRSRGFGCAW